MKAQIFYTKVFHPSEVVDSRFGDIYTKAHYGSESVINLPIEMFRKYWVLMATEWIGNEDYLERLFEKYNTDNNPLGTDAGQQKVKKSGTHHTSMSVLDIIKIGSKYFMVAGAGFKKVNIR